jgi:hypothetical protein
MSQLQGPSQHSRLPYAGSCGLLIQLARPLLQFRIQCIRLSTSGKEEGCSFQLSIDCHQQHGMLLLAQSLVAARA